MIFDTTLYITEAISKQKIGYNTIDKYYKQNKENFYILAQKNKYYNHPYILEGTINQVEYAKKFLGILEYCNTDTNDNQNLNMLKDILKCSFPYAYNFVLEEVNKGTLEIGLNNFLPKLIKKNKNINNLTDDDINSSSIALIFICTIFHIKINEDSFLDTFLNGYIFVRPNIKKGYMDSINNLKIQQLIKENKKIYSTIELNNLALNRQYYHHDEWFSLLTPLELSIDSIFNDTKQVKNIIDYLTLSYNAQFVGLENIKPYKKIPFDDYIVPACIIYKLGQAYNDAKKYYFKNNKENMYIELNQIRNKLNDQILKTDNCILELEETKKNLKKTTNTIKTVVAKQIKEKKELIQLRELFFKLNDKINFDEKIKVIDLNKLNGIKDIVIVGGILPAQQKIKNIIPNAIIINSENFDIKILKDKNMFLFFNKMSHAIYYKLISSEYKSINYFKNFNMDLCIKQIHDIYFKEY